MSNLTVEEMSAQLEALRLENAKLKAEKSVDQKLGIKVSEKGGVSVYGLGRFPVTLYAEQWTKLDAKMPDIKAFITEHKEKLSVKPQVQKQA